MSVSHRSGGFTLLELMVVIVILGLLTAVVAPNVIGHLIRSEREIARMQMREIGNAVDLYTLSARRLPESLDVLTEVDPETKTSLMQAIPRDPWDSDYEYRRFVAVSAYQIRCWGRDRRADTEDDLVHPDDER